MLHPVGDLAPSVYWRRRVLLLATVLLACVSVYAVFFRGGGGGSPSSAGTFSPSGQHTSSAAQSTSLSSSTEATSSTTAAPTACSSSQLTITAASSADRYPTGAKPTVAIVVTNKGPQPCVQDLSDSKIELRVYNGSARVWGSHDCLVQPGTAPATLPVGQPIRREIQWSGLSSRPACAGTRTRVAAGRYTLFAYLAGQQGSTTTFTLAG